jgi:hypothetical protein
MYKKDCIKHYLRAVFSPKSSFFTDNYEKPVKSAFTGSTGTSYPAIRPIGL